MLCSIKGVEVEGFAGVIIKDQVRVSQWCHWRRRGGHKSVLALKHGPCIAAHIYKHKLSVNGVYFLLSLLLASCMLAHASTSLVYIGIHEVCCPLLTTQLSTTNFVLSSFVFVPMFQE